MNSQIDFLFYSNCISSINVEGTPINICSSDTLHMHIHHECNCNASQQGAIEFTVLQWNYTVL